jgi:hypothetical protein
LARHAPNAVLQAVLLRALPFLVLLVKQQAALQLCAAPSCALRRS